ncbi:50S ribosomal protein L4 [Patescibacteria group bacterium]|nr:50S ribosomal protein L4 [Patescibacteria group bacterium]MBU4367879.1 50S ribosomal protein L4 [Patescibacteria group bacterium]MBU4461944.1 50S ribosomal protein L4 [Patescibacteria group bacterium]MCG2699887.1 50S ribosomal protein L4 [Candidatus Parcubacteria bacterium]
MKITVYNIEGKEVGNTLLPKEIFDVKMNSDLVHQVVVSQMANRRQITAHTKDRSEVRGGGRKPWRQKGTGRARAGSIRSPLWRGGGVTFGPRKDKIFKKEVPNKIRKKALFMVLSEKVRKNLLVVLDELKIDKAKTKEMISILQKLPCKKNCLILLPTYDKKVILSARNIPKIVTMDARNLNALDALSSRYLLMPKNTIKSIKETFADKSPEEVPQKTENKK